MPEFSRPSGYLEKLQFAQRVVNRAQFRVDQKQALREVCEAFIETLLALIEREQGSTGQAASGEPEPKPSV